MRRLSMLGLIWLIGCGSADAPNAARKTDRGCARSRAEVQRQVGTIADGSCLPRRLSGPALAIQDAAPAEVVEAIDKNDPKATGSKLRDLGYTLTWLLIRDNPNRSARKPKVGDPLPAASARATLVSEIASPPPGTIVLSVLNNPGERRIPPAPAKLVIEVAKPGTAGHS
jgi:hypothetical protein